MEKPIPDGFLRQSLLAVQDAPDAPASVKERVYHAIDAASVKTDARARAKPAVRVFRFFGDIPPLLAAAAALLVLCSPLLLYRLTAPRAMELAVRSSAGAVTTGDQAVTVGTLIRTGREFRTEDGGHVSLSFERTLTFHLFERSHASIVERGRKSGKIQFGLKGGALYLSRTQAIPGRDVVLSILNHEVRLTGTTLYAEFLDESAYRLICREGLLEVYENGNNGALLATVKGGSYLDMKADGTIIAEGALDDLPAGYRKMFDRLALLSLPGDAGIGVDAGPLPYMIDESAEANDPTASSRDAGTTLGAELGDVATVDVPVKPPFTVTALGKLPGFKSDGANRTLGALCQLKDGPHALLADGLYRLGEAGFVKRLSFTKSPSAAPIVMGNRVLFFFQDRIIDYSDNLDDPIETAFPREGSLQNNYAPVRVGEQILIPLQGSGLYRYSTGSRTLEIMEKEVFPASPVVLPSGFLMSTFYKNTYKKMSADGKAEWEYVLPGRSYLNPVSDGSAYYLYSEDDASQRVIVLDAAGTETRRFSLPESLIADMRLQGAQLFFVSTKGNLFRADTKTGAVTLIKRLYAQDMTSAQWRNLAISVDGARLTTITSSGELEVYSLPGMKSSLKTKLPGSAPFDIQPFAHGNRIYALSRSGEAFLVELNE